MGDNLAELLYMAWRNVLLSSAPDLPSWGNVRDPDVRAAWQAAAVKARKEVERKVAIDMRDAITEYGAEKAVGYLLELHGVASS